MPADRWIAAACFVVSVLLTGVVRRFALVHGVLDVPNRRSSHAAPTPRGGGLAIVATVLPAVAFMDARAMISPDLALVLLAGGAVVAFAGYVDDVRSVSVAARLIVQSAAFCWCVFRLGGLPAVDWGFAVLNLGIAGSVVGVIFLVWFLNLFNFMDGIDGIAGVEVVSATVFAALLLYMTHAASSSIGALLAVAAASAGFLCWNWPPARIFMGDVGSGFLGFVVGAIAWDTVVRGQLSMWIWLILLAGFIVDATVTLLRRWLRGATLTEAHRSHAYQRLSRKYRSHSKVTLGLLLINVVWLDPLAYAAMWRPSYGAALTAIAWLPLAAAACWCGAGTEEE